MSLYVCSYINFHIENHLENPKSELDEWELTDILLNANVRMTINRMPHCINLLKDMC